jgi:hypothetical protein
MVCLSPARAKLVRPCPENKRTGVVTEVIQQLPSMNKMLGSIPSTTDR